MSKFAGVKCAACVEVFKDGDDVVVCPDCGTPHHRDCYAQNGGCVHIENHERMEVLERAVLALKKHESHQALRDEEERVKELETPEFMGVSRAELAAFMHIEPHSPEYESKIANPKVVSFNMFAGLLSPFYQFYRGMRFMGLTLMFISLFTLSVPLISFALMIVMLLFNDYVYRWHCIVQIRLCRMLYEGVKPDLGEGEYISFLKASGKPSVFRAVVESVITFVFIVWLVGALGITPFEMQL
ncbi:MAG: hypothetical protein FWG45_02825 [Oscillospiraceae bacterium]|nr:hypothetical protein [Oscillospiraceae bacterium]